MMLRFLFALSCVLWLQATTAIASHMAIDNRQSGQQCEHISMQGDEGSCAGPVCALQGHAEIRCDALIMRADRIDVTRNDDNSFAGAVGRDHVLLIEGVKVIHCQQVTVGADRVQGRVDDATIEIRRPEAVNDANGMPQGRNQAVMHGNIERLDRDHIVLEEGNFTICDCGDAPPSWRLDSPQIDIEVGERAVIWWPRMSISPLSLVTIPILPPLLPLSFPLKHRALGFLPPVLQFLQLPWPTLDLPFFMPFGDSYDLTLTPGIRTDWGSHVWHPVSPYTFGAPRLGARLRYAPSVGTHGTLQVQLTHDGAHQMAENQLRQDELAGVDVNALGYGQDFQQRYALVERLTLDILHRSELAPGLNWLLDGRWISDDLVNSDFLVTVEERFAQYIPSRSELLWRRPGMTGLLSIDYVLQLSNFAADGTRIYSNVRGAEGSTVQRGPYIGLQLLPLALGSGLHADGGLSFVRYGSWLGELGSQLTLTQATAGLAYLNSVGPVNLTGRLGVDSLWVNTATLPAFVDTALLARIDAEVRFAGPLGDLTHVLVPRLSVRAMPRVWGPRWALDGAELMPDSRQLQALGATPAWQPAWAARSMRRDLDERLLRRVVYQGMTSLHQSLWAQPNASIVTLDLGQPWDLQANAPLTPWAELNWRTPQAGDGGVWASVDFSRWHLQPVRELGARWNFTVGPIGFNIQYLRVAPDADRFERSVYELAAPRLPPLPEQTSDTWAHTVRGSVSGRFGGFGLSVYAAFTLRRPDVDLLLGEPTCHDPDGPASATSYQCPTSYSATLSYSSPCDCWGITSIIAVNPLPPYDVRFNVMFDVAGYRLGASPGKH